MDSCEAAAHSGGMLRRSWDQPWARCVPGLYTHSSLPSRRTTLLQARLEKLWRVAFHSRTSVEQERGDGGWSTCRRAGRREKKGCKRQAGLDTQTQGDL